MSDAIIEKQTRCWFKNTTQHGEDTLGEKINMSLILTLGILSIVNSIVLVVYSVVQVISGQQFLMALLKALIIAALLLVIGLCALHLFRKKLRVLARRKKNPWNL